MHSESIPVVAHDEIAKGLGRTMLCCCMLAVLAACSGDARDSNTENPVVPAPAAGAAAGRFAVGAETHAFTVSNCRATALPSGGLQLRVHGTAHDGTRVSIEVEREDSAERVRESALVTFGAMVDGNNWAAGAVRFPDGRWFDSEAASQPGEGLIRELSDRTVRAEGVFSRTGDDDARPGALQATCPT